MQRNNSLAASSPQLNSIWLEYQKLWQDQSLQAWARHPVKQKNVNTQIQVSIFATLHVFWWTPYKVDVQNTIQYYNLINVPTY